MSNFELSLAELRARPGVKWHRYADDVIPAWIAEMDFQVAEPIRMHMEQATDAHAYGYEDGTLHGALAEGFAAYMQRRYSWQIDADPSLSIPVADLVQALFSSVGAFSERGDAVVVHTPIYPPFLNAIQEMGRRVVEHRLIDDGSRYSMDTSTLRGLVGTPLLLLCNPHNPTGRVFERSELEAIANVVVERDLVVVADEVHADLAHPGHEHTPFASLGPDVATRTVTISSATKAYNIPGLRCGLMHFGSRELFQRFRKSFPDRLLGRVNRLGIEATLCAWRDCEPWLERARDVLQKNRQRVVRFLASELPEVKHYAPEASFLAWLDCRQLKVAGESPNAFFLERARVALSDGAEFGPPGLGHVRVNFGTSTTILDEILRRMAHAVRTG